MAVLPSPLSVLDCPLYSEDQPDQPDCTPPASLVPPTCRQSGHLSPQPASEGLLAAQPSTRPAHRTGEHHLLSQSFPAPLCSPLSGVIDNFSSLIVCPHYKPISQLGSAGLRFAEMSSPSPDFDFTQFVGLSNCLWSRNGTPIREMTGTSSYLIPHTH